MHQTELDLPEALAAEVGVQMSRPQTLGLDLLLQRRGGSAQAFPTEFMPEGLQRPDVLAHERAHPLQLGFEFRLGGEVPGHARTTLSRQVCPGARDLETMVGR